MRAATGFPRNYGRWMDLLHLTFNASGSSGRARRIRISRHLSTRANDEANFRSTSPPEHTFFFYHVCTVKKTKNESESRDILM